jgi:hypothetical protein
VLRRIEISAGTGLYPRVPTLLQKRRQPRRFKVAANQDQEVGPHELGDVAGFQLDEVRVLVAARDGLHSDRLSADLTRERREIFGCRHHVDGALSRNSGRQQYSDK